MENIKTFDELNEELFGIGKANPTKRLVDDITSAILDNKSLIQSEGSIMSFSMKLPNGHVSISSPQEIIKAMETSLKVDGEDIELSNDQKNRIQTQLKNYVTKSSGSRATFENTTDVVKFSDFK